MKFDFDRQFKYKINDDMWRFFLITEEEAHEVDEHYNQITEGFRAMTTTEDKCVFMVEGSVTKAIIAHELFHVYVSYFYLKSSNVTVDDFEEITAEFLEKDLDKFIKKRNTIYKKYKELENAT